MNAPDSPLRAVREIEHLLIPLGDGRRLAARLWLPEDAGVRPIPAILEYLPYRKRDHTAPRDESMHPWMAARGYACIRVDIRGNGESDGLMLGEYLPQELADGVEVIHWLARQPWCDGRVGMLGISWGGFNGLQIAALRPEPLRAVITICSTDDRYADDIHYKGGCLLNDNLAWGATMLALSSRPPDPLLAPDWRAMWLHRLDNMPFMAADWLEHQRRDDFWRRGSVCEDYDAIEAAVFAVGGWADPYSNAIPRLLAGLRSPAFGLIGPWGHKYPHLGVPGPPIDFLQEMRAFWDRHLAGRPGTFEDVPKLRAYLLDGPDPGRGPDERRGWWITEPSWPSPGIDTRPLYLAADRTLSARPGAQSALSLRSPPTVGLAGGRFYPRLGRPDLPRDQRPDDALSLCFDGEPLTSPLDIVGAPTLSLELASDTPRAVLAARLCAVAPDGASHRVTFGLLNLTHRNGHASPEPLAPGERFRVRLQLDDIAYRVPAGHRLRVALSTGYWPMIWPSPSPATLTLTCGSARIDLPVRRPAAGNETTLPPVPEPLPSGLVQLTEPESERRIEEDLMDGTVTVTWADDTGRKRFLPHGLEMRLVGRETYRLSPPDPLSARAETAWTTLTARGDWSVRTESRTSMRSDADTFHLQAELVVLEGEEEVRRHRFERAIPRDQV
jgi:uncharacterized protein